ncbi:permease [Yinghuangia sp. KLBMP8922]|uniref:Permease n=2 Tax=Yinghuangia soli TaxID=2908204 RepID=A0AA41U2E4_9ACTN|nr:permease [Yinghuangia soli]MCF2530595.1 permease [Yinghuangia soli]
MSEQTAPAHGIPPAASAPPDAGPAVPDQGGPAGAAPGPGPGTTAGKPGGGPGQAAPPRLRLGQLELFVLGLLLLLVGQSWIADRLDARAVQTWSTVFVAIAVQALPFLVLGTVISAAITAFVPPSVFTKVLPRNQALAVPVAGAAGAVLPGCECASVPVAGGLMARGVAPAAALAFLLSAPAINPIVMTATAVAFPNQPEMVFARFGASLATAVIMGWLWVRFGKAEWLRIPKRFSEPSSGSRWEDFRVGMQHDFLHAGGFLVVGAITAATLNVTVPKDVIDAVSDNWWIGVLALAFLAVILAVCSEADAFVAASLTGFSPTAKLAFMVVGPMVDVKLIALQSGTFGRAFAVRFSTATFAVAVLTSLAVGWWLL